MLSAIQTRLRLHHFFFLPPFTSWTILLGWFAQRSGSPLSRFSSHQPGFSFSYRGRPFAISPRVPSLRPFKCLHKQVAPGDYVLRRFRGSVLLPEKRACW